MTNTPNPNTAVTEMRFFVLLILLIALCFHVCGPYSFAFATQESAINSPITLTDSNEGWKFLCPPNNDPNDPFKGFYFSRNYFWIVREDRSNNTTNLKKIAITNGQASEYEIDGLFHSVCFVGDHPVGLKDGPVDEIHFVSLASDAEFSKLFSGYLIGSPFVIEDKYICFPRFLPLKETFVIDLVSFSVARDDKGDFVLEDGMPYKVEPFNGCNCVYLDVSVSDDGRNLVLASTDSYKLVFIKRRLEIKDRLEWEVVQSTRIPALNTAKYVIGDDGNIDWRSASFSVSSGIGYVVSHAEIGDSREKEPASITLVTIQEFAKKGPFFESVLKSNRRDWSNCLMFVDEDMLFYWSDDQMEFLEIFEVDESKRESLGLITGGKRDETIGRRAVRSRMHFDLPVQKDESIGLVLPIPDKKMLLFIKLSKQGYYFRTLDWGKLLEQSSVPQ